MDEIFKEDGSSSYMKSEDGLEARRFHFGNFFCREGTAPPIVARHLPSGELFFSEILQSFFGAKTLITLSFSGQPIGKFTIDGDSLRLTIRTGRSLLVRALIPGNPKPLKIFDDSINGGVGRSL
jgi:hypothetical protein